MDCHTEAMEFLLTYTTLRLKIASASCTPTGLSYNSLGGNVSDLVDECGWGRPAKASIHFQASQQSSGKAWQSYCPSTIGI